MNGALLCFIEMLRAMKFRLREVFLNCIRCATTSSRKNWSRLPDLSAQISLTSPEVLDKILRHETMLQRQLHRAMNQLERLQRRRRGGLPPPLTMEVSGRP
jgi:hypothetical protein